MTKLRVCVFGRFAAGEEFGALRLAPSEARLLACLALHHPAPVQRARVAGLLWGDWSEPRAGPI